MLMKSASTLLYRTNSLLDGDHLNEAIIVLNSLFALRTGEKMSESCYSGLLLSLNGQPTKLRNLQFDAGRKWHLRLAVLGSRQIIYFSVPIVFLSIARGDSYFVVHSEAVAHFLTVCVGFQFSQDAVPL